MTKRDRLKDEGEVEISITFTPDTRRGEPGRIIFPADDGTEQIFNVILYQTDNPDVLEVFSENGHRIGTVEKAGPND